MFSFWLFREFHLNVDAYVYVGIFGLFIEVLATLVFTAFGLLLCWSVGSERADDNASNPESKGRHWTRSGVWVFAFVAMLALAGVDEVVFVCLIQATIFYAPVLYSSRRWKRMKFEIRDIMICMILVCCFLVFLVNIPVIAWTVWPQVVVVGVAFGALNLVAYGLVRSRYTKTRWLLGVAVPYITLLTIILSLGKASKASEGNPLTTKLTLKVAQRVLCVVVFFPIVLLVTSLLYARPKPAEIGAGKNVIDEIILLGDKIGNISKLAPPYPRDGPTLRPFPKTIAQLRSVVAAYGQHTAECRSLSGDPAWLSVNYQWKDISDFEGRIKEGGALQVLTTTMLAEGQLAFLENRVDDGLSCFCDAMNLNRQCSSGGLPMNTGAAYERDLYMMEKFSGLQDKLSPAQGVAFANRLFEQCDAFEPADVLMERRLAWEDRVPRWHERLALKYLFWEKRHPGFSLVHRASAHRCQLKLLALQLLIRSHEKSNGDLPEALDEVLSGQQKKLNVDPLSESGAPFCFKRTDGGYVLYSVGWDGADDGGGSLDFTFDSCRKQISWKD